MKFNVAPNLARDVIHHSLISLWNGFHAIVGAVIEFHAQLN